MSIKSDCLEAFEEWAKSRGWNIARFDNPSGYIEYKTGSTHHVWMGWESAWKARADDHRVNTYDQIVEALEYLMRYGVMNESAIQKAKAALEAAKRGGGDE